MERMIYQDNGRFNADLDAISRMVAKYRVDIEEIIRTKDLLRPEKERFKVNTH